MPVRYTLVGPNAGKTIHLGSAAPAGYDFVDGVYIFPGSENDSKLLDRVLTGYYSAFPDSMLAGAQAAYQAALAQPIPAAKVVSEADDKKAVDEAAAKKAADDEAAKKAAAEKPDLATWLKALDPDVKDNWTESTGAVSMKAVEAVFGKDTSRADVEKALPGWNLAKAKAAKVAADPLA